MKISGGVRYVDIGDANSLQTQNAPGGAATFQGNSALGVCIKVGFTF
jgi:hypothetical protein